MSPSNLGIVFGPTLLRPLVSTDMPTIIVQESSYQAALVEFLITHHERIFGLQQRSCTPPPPAPTAPLPDTPPQASCPLEGEVYPEHDTSFRERPVSVEVSAAARKTLNWNTGYRSVAVCLLLSLGTLTWSYSLSINMLDSCCISAAICILNHMDFLQALLVIFYCCSILNIFNRSFVIYNISYQMARVRICKIRHQAKKMRLVSKFPPLLKCAAYHFNMDLACLKIPLQK